MFKQAKRWSVLLVCVFCISVAFGCEQSEKSDEALARRVKALQNKIDQIKPGFGEIMGGIQTHHAKLYYAGTNKNWGLTDFEIHEIEENVEKIEALYPDDKRIRQFSELKPVLDSLEADEKAKNVERFKKDFTLLTHTCNDCHQANGYEFNVITIPDNPPVTNQKFRMSEGGQ